jgi:hypothetical protein
LPTRAERHRGLFGGNGPGKLQSRQVHLTAELLHRSWVLSPSVVVNQLVKETPVIKKRYAKPSLQRLGLLRDLTRFSF